jgi:hypothetical protein
MALEYSVAQLPVLSWDHQPEMNNIATKQEPRSGQSRQYLVVMVVAYCGKFYAS